MSWLQWLQMQPCIAKPPARAWKHDSFRQSGIWAVFLMHFAYFALRTVIDVMVIESVLGWLTGRILRCWFLLAQGCWPHVLRQCCFLLHSLAAWRMLQSLPQLMTVVAMQSLNARRHADNMDSHLPKDLYVHYPHNSVVLCFIMFYLGHEGSLNPEDILVDSSRFVFLMSQGNRSETDWYSMMMLPMYRETTCLHASWMSMSRYTCCACIVPVKVTLVRWRSENTVSVMKSRPNIKICLFLSACVVERSAWAHATSFALCTFVLTVSIYWSVLCFLDLLSKYHEWTIEPFTLCWPIRKIIDIHRPIMIHISWIAAVRLSSDIQWLHWWSALPNSPRNVQKGKSFKRGRLGGSSCVRHVFVFFWCTASGFVCDL